MRLLYNRHTLSIYKRLLVFLIMLIVSLQSVLFYTLSPFEIVLSQTKLTSPNQSGTFVDSILLSMIFSVNQIYHRHGVAYDYYSKDDLGRTTASDQWNVWPLPNQLNETSPLVLSNLPFVDAIYVMTDPRLTDRQTSLRNVFRRQGISTEMIDWRMKWNRTTCTSNASHSYVYRRLHLEDQPLKEAGQQRCALAMKHVDVWYEMAERNVSLGLILEDDAIFVPFFKEKLTRMIYSAINTGILRLNKTCVHQQKNHSISNDERIEQNPMIVIGGCFSFHGASFEKDRSNASPLLSTHKSDASRCSHAYLLTSCSAQALVDQIQAQKNPFSPSDFLQNYLFRLSATLQSFWMDPPLVYQGNQVRDLDQIASFKMQTYLSDKL